jgi:hypothetical protein
LLGLFFELEDEGDMFFRNVGWFSTDYTASYTRRQNSKFVSISQKPYNLCKCILDIKCFTFLYKFVRNVFRPDKLLIMYDRVDTDMIAKRKLPATVGNRMKIFYAKNKIITLMRISWSERNKISLSVNMNPVTWILQLFPWVLHRTDDLDVFLWKRSSILAQRIQNLYYGKFFFFVCRWQKSFNHCFVSVCERTRCKTHQTSQLLFLI